MTALELRQVSKVYGEGATRVEALREVSLSVEAGTLVALTGPSGSGKSTLLKIAGSLEDATTGAVIVGGIALSGMSPKRKAQLRRRLVGYVFQDFNLLSGLTAAENVALPLELDGKRPSVARAQSLRVLEELGLAGLAGRFPGALSSADSQRVAIARAVVGEHCLLLADEPSGALDSIAAEGTMRLLRAACKRGVAGVVATGDSQFASWADRVIFLRDGRVAGQTSPPPGPESLLEPLSRQLPAFFLAGAVASTQSHATQWRRPGSQGLREVEVVQADERWVAAGA